MHQVDHWGYEEFDFPNLLPGIMKEIDQRVTIQDEYIVSELNIMPRIFDNGHYAAFSIQMLRNCFNGKDPYQHAAIVITQFRYGYIEVLFAEEYDRPLQNEIIERVIRLNNKHHIGRILVDASNAGFISSLKQQIGDFDYKSYVQNDRVIKNIYDSRLRQFNSNVKVLPVNFGTMNGEMLLHVNTILSSRRLRIHTSFTKLITSLRTAQVMNDKWSLDKEQTSYNDILDSFRLSLLNYYFTPK